MKPDLITLMIVDDHPVVRDGLAAMLSSEPDIKQVGEAATGTEAIAMYRTLRPSVVVMDLLLPDMSGTEAIRQIYSDSNDANIIVLTSVAGDEQIYQALEAGARGYLLKDMARKELSTAIRTVFDGKRYIPDRVGACLAKNLPRSGISSRELEVLKLVAMGMRNKEIAYQLSISEATVNAHVKHILDKLNASDRTHAVTTALRRGFIHL